MSEPNTPSAISSNETTSKNVTDVVLDPTSTDSEDPIHLSSLQDEANTPSSVPKMPPNAIGDMIVLMHGIEPPGTTSPSAKSSDDLICFEETLRSIPIFASAVILRTSAYTGRTTRGIAQCARRLALDIASHARATGFPRLRLSLVGHSLGGLIGRAVLGHLHALALTDLLLPIVFCSVASPHLGIARPKGFSAMGFVMEKVTRLVYLGSQTIRELMLTDDGGTSGCVCSRGECACACVWVKDMECTCEWMNAEWDDEAVAGSAEQEQAAEPAREGEEAVPLLMTMASPESIYFRMLKRFHTLLTVANISGDMAVPYCTSSIQTHNPYVGPASAASNTMSKDGTIARHSGFQHSVYFDILGERGVDAASISSYAEAQLGACYCHLHAGEHMLSTTSDSEGEKEEENEADVLAAQRAGLAHDLSLIENSNASTAIVRDMCSYLQMLPWCRVDVRMGDALFSHELCVGKVNPITSKRPKLKARAEDIVQRLCCVLAAEHGLHKRENMVAPPNSTASLP